MQKIIDWTFDAKAHADSFVQQWVWKPRSVVIQSNVDICGLSELGLKENDERSFFWEKILK